jgi:hypothetical protein
VFGAKTNSSEMADFYQTLRFEPTTYMSHFNFSINIFKNYLQKHIFIPIIHEENQKQPQSRVPCIFQTCCCCGQKHTTHGASARERAREGPRMDGQEEEERPLKDQIFVQTL